MKDEIFRKGLIIGVICVLMIPSVAVASTESNSDYNLKVKIKNTKLFYNSESNYRLLVNVSNEGPDFSDNYSVSVDVYRLISRRIGPWFTSLSHYSYTGSTIAPGGYEKTLVSFLHWDVGWYLARATVNSNDNNPLGNVSYCFIWVQFH